MNSDEWIIHLTELRKRLIWVMLFFIVTLAAGLYMSPQVLLYIKNRPAAADIAWNVFSLTDGMFIYMKSGFLVAVFFTLPLALYHIWAFVRPGLTTEEAKKTFWFIPLAFVLFIIGAAFSFYVAFPMMVSFLSQMNKTVGAVETYGMDKYFSLLFSVVFPLSLAFEMPAVVLFLTRLGILGPALLKKARKYVYLILAIVGSMISPPDFVSHLSVTIPLIMLFELSILVSGWYMRKKETSNPLIDPKGGASHV
ncbi:twin-arginine translocase subunit TatC [Paenibacillus donghaensis]|uniref:twin-arginine translocase subunit TatC n=1 Tax=Paenibacillus donghaensis TaxID=414771 RepID=UPI00188399A2|nr:twin-arginine translocase subunit TatC [Paenibacillus donghaensis]MBE9915569.1 twin-arginine translocase subunit TatC [Paenibacillus donghaensis]